MVLLQLGDGTDLAVFPEEVLPFLRSQWRVGWGDGGGTGVEEGRGTGKKRKNIYRKKVSLQNPNRKSKPGLLIEIRRPLVVFNWRVLNLICFLLGKA